MLNQILTRDSPWTHADAAQALVSFAQDERAKDPSKISLDEAQALKHVDEAIGNIMQLTTNDLLMIQASMEVAWGKNPPVDVYSAACVAYALLLHRRDIAEKTKGQLFLFPENPRTVREWSRWLSVGENIAHSARVQAMLYAESQPFTSDPDASLKFL